MKKLLEKFKMQRLILCLCILAVAFSLIIGAFGVYSIKDIDASMKNIYDYHELINSIDQIHENFLKMKVQRLEAEKIFEDRHLEFLGKENDVILREYQFTMEYAIQLGDEEKAWMNTFYNAYNEYYGLVEEKLLGYKKGINSSKEDDGRILSLELIALQNLDYVKETLQELSIQEKLHIEKDTIKAAITNGLLIVLCMTLFAFIATVILKVFNKQMKDINKTLNQVANGNLAVNINTEGKTEFDEIKGYVHKTTNSFGGIIRDIKRSSEDINVKSESLSQVSIELASSSNNILATMENISKGTEEQASYIVEVTSILNSFGDKIEEFINSLGRVNESTGEISKMANVSSDRLDDLGRTFTYIEEAITKFMNKITELSHLVDEVGEITNIINGVAEQTNLLALNAAIESARVGEAGKGFTVVAEEIRKLAEQSKEASKNISQLILEVSNDTKVIVIDGDEVSNKLKESSQVIDLSLQSFKDIITSVEEVAPKLDNLVRASEVINKEKDEISTKIENTSAIAEEVVASSEEVLGSLSEMNQCSQVVENTAGNLNDLTTILDEKIEIFKIK